MPKMRSPLRYPGSKGQISGNIQALIEEYPETIETYFEPFCGGAAVALELLLEGIVGRVWLNDADPGIYSFWKAIVTETERFCAKLQTVPLNVEEWNHWKSISDQAIDDEYDFDLGFANFYLNRTNHSGVIRGGLIGGRSQTGKYKMDCRFNREALTDLIERIADQKDRIIITGFDGVKLLGSASEEFGIENDSTFVFVDPPYVKKADRLYMNHFKLTDHYKLGEVLYESSFTNWLLTYDDDALVREIYAGHTNWDLKIGYSAHKKRNATEVLVSAPALAPYCPKAFGTRIK
ncbi:DNA adenine methylase [Corynebacterium aquatimens]|uniref:site-specific DNA-methyltransferase (adenine-specific) n=1 Tax=Corynebacterium aquatimens TaxID=1190508 RepID=A0A931E651_9CORY|nr:DNA adenine methylase [Corynebacterium aquatimens]MBG6123123.1 DNA adenine methylase [Corynebacterium aquatimens]WJY66545.1 D12 class N6 adenine-specific DNA methyltransferase [Corynebacterium aquatimens]